MTQGGGGGAEEVEVIAARRWCGEVIESILR